MELDKYYFLNYYNQDHQFEWDREKRHRTECASTTRVSKEYLLVPPADVLVCGGGKGKYILELLRQGYRATLLDQSKEN